MLQCVAESVTEERSDRYPVQYLIIKKSHKLSVYCIVLQCLAVYCSVLQCVAVCCSVLQCVAVCLTNDH